MPMSQPFRSAWHEGERALQESAGAADRLAQRVLPPFMPVDHRWFFEQLALLAIGSVDAQGWPWASLLGGRPGFASSPDASTLRVTAAPAAGDPLAQALAPGAQLGVLGIDLATASRVRMNGRVATVDGTGFAIAVDQSYGNCPKFIRPRDDVDRADAPAPGAFASFDGIDAQARALVARADTFFVATSAQRAGGDPALHGVDASHRGGPPGFVHVGADDLLTIPDYRGNRFFNTLGNLLVSPRAGLCFPDFDNGDLVLLTGTADVVLAGDAVRSVPGAERVWRVRPVRGRRLVGALRRRFVTRD